MKPMAKGDAWWPSDLGEPASTGSADDLHYAYFPDAGRLAVRGPKGAQARVYDTGGKRLRGFSSKSGSGLRFSTDDGEADLESLKRA